MMQRWGTTAVTSAFEVYLTLAAPPADPHAHSAWLDLLAIEPPVWGGTRAARAASKLTARGLRVWSWDDCTVVFSQTDAQPPGSLRYRAWHPLELAPEPSPRSRAMRPLFGP
jgi:hypothetical protein